MNDWINHQALEWAWHCDKVNSTAERVTLVSYAKHCDEHGYSGVSVRTIASTWHLHHITISQARDRLIAARLLHETKRRRGQTRQTKVYRLPKIAWESGLQTDASRNRKRSQSGQKAVTKRSPSDHEQLIMNNQDISVNGNILDSKTARAKDQAEPKPISYQPSAYQHQHQNQNQHQGRSARDHVKWPEFVAYCDRQPCQFDKYGRPRPKVYTEKGFRTWLAKQKSQWRNKVRVDSTGEPGYRLDGRGRFLTVHEANVLGQKNAELLVRFQPATRKANGVVVNQPANGTEP